MIPATRPGRGRLGQLLLLTTLLCGGGWSGAAVAASAQASPDAATLVVGTRVAPPFVMRAADGSYSGISIELWEQIADRLGLQWRYEETDLGGLIEGLESRRFDLSIAALTVTAQREARIDFTHPFHSTGLAIAVPRRGSPLWSTLGQLFSLEFLYAVAALGGLLLLVGVALWLAERRQNSAMFGGSPARGIGASFWWAAVTMTTVGYGDKAPITFLGRAVALVWMFAAIILISGFTAAIATSLTVSRLESVIEGVEDLPDARVGTVQEAVSVTALDDRGVRARTFATLEDAMTALDDGELDAVVHDAPILRYVTRQDFAGRIQILPETFEPQAYAIALPQGSPRTEAFNRALLETTSSDAFISLMRRYLGD